jgi:hypothetical protein
MLSPAGKKVFLIKKYASVIGSLYSPARKICPPVGKSFSLKGKKNFLTGKMLSQTRTRSRRAQETLRRSSVVFFMPALCSL